MCGIYGYTGFEEAGLLERMARVQVHRGPDGEGSLHVPEQRFAMGMRRLSIIDLDGGWQPIFNEARNLAVVLNGEIYNYRELREVLTSAGHVFATASDTEVLVHGFEEWGLRGLLERLNGMFAFCLHDRATGGFFLARDRTGQKPLYYHAAHGRFLFASEAKSLLQSVHVPARCRVASIDAYLTLRNVPEPNTMFEGIFTLPTAHCLHYRQDGNFTIERYWDVPLHDGRTHQSDDAFFDEFEALFDDSIRLHMRSDVPVGAYLSGGVDSSLIVAGMTKVSSRINTYSIGFNSPIDETRDAADTARFLGTNHHTINVEPGDFDLLPKIVWHMDRPVGDALIIAFYKLASGASQDLKVVLGGEGADECFAGYDFHKKLSLAQKLGPLAGMAGMAVNMIPHTLLNKVFHFPADLGSQGKKRGVDFLKGYRRRHLMANFYALRTLWSEDERLALYSPALKHQANENWIPLERDLSFFNGRGQTPPIAQATEDAPFLDRLLRIQYDEWLQDWALIRQDKNTMAHSLEYRLPFLDHRLIELAQRMPVHLKLRKGVDKWIERRLADQAFAGMPANKPGHRPKIPFFLPLEFFYQHPQFKSLVNDTLSESQINARGYFDYQEVSRLLKKMETREFVWLKQVMSLVILELWHRAFIDGQGAA